MIYTAMTKLAMKIAYDAHNGQLDKCGVPYIYHPIHLAEQMKDEISVCAALLHDVVEDTDITFEYMAEQGISDAVIESLRFLTHNNSVPYMDYLQGIKSSGNQTAIAVKLADLYHNSDITRLDSIDDEMIARINKYRAAINILEEH